MINKAFLLTLLAVILSLLHTRAEQPSWNKEKTEDGIVVNYRITDTLINGISHSLLHYRVESTITSSYHNCVSILKKAENYSAIFDYTEESKTIKALGRNEWLIYFYLDMPWPMADSDAVYKMKVSESTQPISTNIVMTSNPDMMPAQKVKRAKVGYSKYLVEQMGNKQVKLTIETLSVPVSEAPEWMLKAWFPDGPAKIIRQIEEMAKQ